MEKKDYQEIIDLVSKEVSKQFIEKESDLIKRARFIDADIAEITRKIGAKATKNVLESLTETLVEKKNQKD